MKSTNAILLIIIALATSCITRKQVTYFQPESQNKDIEQLDIQQKHVSKLKSGDILGIMVSSLSPEASSMFNPYSSGSGITTGQSSGSLPATPGYLIDENGFIALPLIGKIHAAGLSSEEITDKLTEKLNQYLVQPTVYVRILNFKISVLGEVIHPSVYIIPNEKITLPEALSLAGDLTIFGRRTNILIVREVEGKREFARVDITKRDFFNSPYYFLKSNDMIYVEPGKGKILSSDGALQLSPIIISVLTFLIVVFSIVHK
jgi:polysaccharide export outer membrane protein